MAQPATIGGAGVALWVVVSTHQRRERLAIANLDRQGFKAYCPMLLERNRHARRVEHALQPMFPGYVFVAVASERQRWQPILSTYGVRSVVRTGERPSQLPSGFVESLRAREVDGAVVRPSVPFFIGQTVTMTRGAFDGEIATIVGMEKHDRLILLGRLLQRQVRIDVDAVTVTDLPLGRGG